MPVNEQLQDLMITHQQNVELYKRNLANRAERVFRRGVRRLRTALRSYADNDSDTNTIESIRVRRAIERELLQIQREINEEFEETLNKDIQDFTEAEKRFYTNTLRMVFEDAALEIPVREPKENVAYNRTRSLPMNLRAGVTARYIEELTRPGLSSNRYLRDNIRRAFTLGISIYILSNTLFSRTTGIYNSIFRSARTTANLLAQHATSTTRKTFFEQNRNIIKGYKWVSVLDSRTSDTCQYLSERVWYYEEPERSTLPGPIEPPAHYNCRSSTTPIVKGVTEMSERLVQRQPISAIAAGLVLTGAVPRRTSYLQWLQRQPASIQQEVLGAVRYNLWKKGEIEIDQFYSKDARYYTLEELEELGVSIPEEYLRYINGER